MSIDLIVKNDSQTNTNEEKTKNNLTPIETRMLDTVLFELRMTFLELTKMISLQGVQVPPPKPEKH